MARYVDLTPTGINNWTPSVPDTSFLDENQDGLGNSMLPWTNTLTNPVNAIDGDSSTSAFFTNANNQATTLTFKNALQPNDHTGPKIGQDGVAAGETIAANPDVSQIGFTYPDGTTGPGLNLTRCKVVSMQLIMNAWHADVASSNATRLYWRYWAKDADFYNIQDDIAGSNNYQNLHVPWSDLDASDYVTQDYPISDDIQGTQADPIEVVLGNVPHDNSWWDLGPFTNIDVDWNNVNNNPGGNLDPIITYGADRLTLRHIVNGDAWNAVDPWDRGFAIVFGTSAANGNPVMGGTGFDAININNIKLRVWFTDYVEGFAPDTDEAGDYGISHLSFIQKSNEISMGGRNCNGQNAKRSIWNHYQSEDVSGAYTPEFVPLMSYTGMPENDFKWSNTFNGYLPNNANKCWTYVTDAIAANYFEEEVTVGINDVPEGSLYTVSPGTLADAVGGLGQFYINAGLDPEFLYYAWIYNHNQATPQGSPYMDPQAGGISYGNNVAGDLKLFGNLRRHGMYDGAFNIIPPNAAVAGGAFNFFSFYGGGFGGDPNNGIVGSDNYYSIGGYDNPLLTGNDGQSYLDSHTTGTYENPGADGVITSEFYGKETRMSCWEGYNKRSTYFTSLEEDPVVLPDGLY